MSFFEIVLLRPDKREREPKRAFGGKENERQEDEKGDTALFPSIVTPVEARPMSCTHNPPGMLLSPQLYFFFWVMGSSHECPLPLTHTLYSIDTPSSAGSCFFFFYLEKGSAFVLI